MLLLPTCNNKDISPNIPPDGGDSTEVVVPEANDYSYTQARSSKRGLCFNTLYAQDFAVVQSRVSWMYNWGTSYNSTLEEAAAASQILYFPMLWNDVSNSGKTAIRKYKESHPECEYILAFNEPNLTDQANMTPTQAAAKWAAVKDLATELGMKIVAPAMNYGTLANYSDPVVWLDEFFAIDGVSIDDVDALALHCYMNSPSAVKSYVERFRKYNKPIWMTEFCAWEGNRTAEQQREFMSDILNYFENDPIIERYSWFMYEGNPAANPQYALRPSGNRNGELTDLGKVYINMSSQDKNTYYSALDVIPAEHYSNTNMSAVVGSTTWQASVQLKVCSDSTGILEVANFGLPKWLEYPISVVAAGSYSLTIRYAASSDSKCKIRIGDTDLAEIDLPKTGSYTTWATLTTPPITLNAGNQSLRFVMSKGMVSMNWWKFKK
ncbi:hypothetical protein AGMMS4956_12090 [Bacteroidia bacterium]|nr:hypothetical protein AGMMS4956_12090 [Bacteroidia bacterium]